MLQHPGYFLIEAIISKHVVAIGRLTYFVNQSCFHVTANSA